MSKTRAFTLVELLVVISIIALLLSILMPSLQKSREQARKIVCSSRLRQTGLTQIIYSQDNRSKLIPQAGTVDSAGKLQSAIPYYLKDSIYEDLKRYGFKPINYVCPALAMSPSSFRGSSYFLPDGGLIKHIGMFPDPVRWMGYVQLQGLQDLPLAEPKSVKESPKNTCDSGNKHLGADINLRWANNWNWNYSFVSHKKGWLPQGSSRMYLDLHVEWINPEKMGFGDMPLKRAEGRYDHSPSSGRDYYW